MFRHVFLFILLLTGSLILPAQNCFSHDSLLRRIYDLQNTADGPGLLNYTCHREVKYREAACLAFATVQDTLAIPVLKKLLERDQSLQVRRAALYSLGQYRDQELTQYLKRLYGKKKNIALYNDLLTAIAKGAKLQDMSFFEHFNLKKGDSLTVFSFVYAVHLAYRKTALSDDLKARIAWIDSFTANSDLHELCNALLVRKQVVPENKATINPDTLSLQDILDTPLLYRNPYWMLRSMEMHPVKRMDLLALALNDSLPHVVRTRCLERYFLMASKDTTDLLRILNTGDVALVSLGCIEILNDSMLLKWASRHKAELAEMQKELHMPRDFETWVDLEKLLCRLEGRTYSYRSWFSHGYSYPVDWHMVRGIPEAQRIRITTSKGVVVIQLRVNEAPGTVANFLKLLDSGYYNGKYFHRVVPGFVAQGGCPRGDGWGSADWCQRSEFSNYLRYRTGSVGLASAGKDSESVQFFFTLAQTPHLDGRYTIFAEVVAGLRTIQMLEVGDRIFRMERL